MQNVQRIALIIVVVGAAAIGASWFLEAREEHERADERNRAARKAENAERAKAGPYLESDKMVSPTEKLSVVVIPHPWGAWMDKRCLIYLNTEYSTSAMNCDFEALPPDVRPSAGPNDDAVPWDIAGTR